MDSVGLKKRRFRNRMGRCFELAYLHLVDAADDWRLVHGEVDCVSDDGGPGRTGHGWLEMDELVYDAVLDRLYERKTYYERFNAAANVRYSKREAAGEVSKTGHSGPWH